MKVAVVGLGYVGVVTAACVTCQGHTVWGVDVDTTKVDEICAGKLMRHRSGRSPVGS
jgi:UDP-N-acetyl-D-mannosaminuronate dehydrogenase